jgi:hypothetical protein
METILSDYESRKFMIFDVSELSNIDFNAVLETSEDTVRKSVDETKTFVKWDGSIPECVLSLNTKQGPYNYEEIIAILSTEIWQNPNQLI